MAKWDGLVASIVNNPELHQVDKVAKMDKTINVMCENLEVRHSLKSEGDVDLNGTNKHGGRGYGKGKRMGD